MKTRTLFFYIVSLIVISCNNGNENSKIQQLEEELKEQSNQIKEQSNQIQEEKERTLRDQLERKDKEIEELKNSTNVRSIDSKKENFNYYAKEFGKYPKGSNKRLKHSDVSNLSKYELKIMRNEIFARHGYIFKTSAMAQYFSGQSWYRPLHKDVSSKLSTTEKDNVNFIKRYE